MKKFVILIVALALLAGVALAVRTIGARDETSKVDAKDAKDAIIDDGDEAASDDEDVAPGLRPAAGTYQYSGGGSENVDALGGSKHDFPKQISLVVQLDPKDDCAWSSNLIYVEEHVEKRAFCTTDAGMLDRGFKREIEFFNLVEKTSFECADDAMRIKTGAKVGDSWSWTCTQGEHETEATYTATVVALEPVLVDGERVSTVRTKVVADLTGKTNGRDVSEFWFLESGLAAKFTTQLEVKSDSVIGDTNFVEKTSYTLDSLDPAVAET